MKISNHLTQFKKLSQRFYLIYGKLWTAQFADVDSVEAIVRMWNDVLNKFNDEIIFAALEKIESGKTEFSKFPPTLGKFKMLCAAIESSITHPKKSLAQIEIESNEKIQIEKELEECSILDSAFPNWREILENRPKGKLWGVARSELLAEARKFIDIRAI